MTDTVNMSTPERGPQRSRRAATTSRTVLHALDAGRRWFRAWRRTRPFWGGLWTVLAGLEIIKAMSFSIGLALTGGWSHSAGYVMGGGLVLFGLTAWFTPHYRGLAGVVAFLIALGAFPTANLGGYLLGSVLGIIGSSMIWSWGPKRPGRRERHRLERQAAEPVSEAG